MPRKLYLGPLTDSRRWQHIALRAGDVIVATPPKSGTTWMQVILALLLSGDPDVEPELARTMPWVDIRFRPIGDLAGELEAMQGRRAVKTHTPLDGLPLSEDVQYICVFRHPLDVHFSFRKHLENTPMPFFGHWFPEGEAGGGTGFANFLAGGPEGFDGDAATLAHILRHYEAALALAGAANVTLFHYADMRRDLAGTFARVAKLLGVAHPPELMERLVAVAGFDTMKANASRYIPVGPQSSMKSHAAFFDSGSSGKWEGRLTADELAAYDAAMEAALTPEARGWLEFGGTGAA